MEGSRLPLSKKRKRSADAKTYKDKVKAQESRDTAKQWYGAATAVFVELGYLEEKSQFRALCRNSVEKTLRALYQSRREEAGKWLETTDRKPVQHYSVALRNATAESWANQIGEKLQGTIEKLCVDLTDHLNDNEVESASSSDTAREVALNVLHQIFSTSEMGTPLSWLSPMNLGLLTMEQLNDAREELLAKLPQDLPDDCRKDLLIFLGGRSQTHRLALLGCLRLKYKGTVTRLPMTGDHDESLRFTFSQDAPSATSATMGPANSTTGTLQTEPVTMTSHQSLPESQSRRTAYGQSGSVGSTSPSIQVNRGRTRDAPRKPSAVNGVNPLFYGSHAFGMPFEYLNALPLSDNMTPGYHDEARNPEVLPSQHSLIMHSDMEVRAQEHSIFAATSNQPGQHSRLPQEPQVQQIQQDARTSLEDFRSNATTYEFLNWTQFTAPDAMTNGDLVSMAHQTDVGPSSMTTETSVPPVDPFFADAEARLRLALDQMGESDSDHEMT